MPTSEIRIVSDDSARSIMVNPQIIYRPSTVKGRTYVVTAERPTKR